MTGRMNTWFCRIGLFLMLAFIISAISACGPIKIPESMSDEDLQTCADTAAEIAAKVTFPVPDYMKQVKPWLATPAEAEIVSPLNGSVLPYEIVEVHFKQPAPDPSVEFRNYDVFVTPFDSDNSTKLYNPLNLIPINYIDLQSNWTPSGSGKFLIFVLFRNFRTGGNAKGYPMTDFGPYSLAYTCIKIKPVTIGDASTMAVMPTLQNFPTQATLTPSQTFTLTFTLTSSPTLINTFTFTPTIQIPTKTFTPKPPTATFTTEPVSCSSYPDQRSCPTDKCQWYVPPTGGPGSCIDK